MNDRCTLGAHPSHSESTPLAAAIVEKASTTPSYLTPDCIRILTRSVGDVRKVPTAPAMPPATIICHSFGCEGGSPSLVDALRTASRIGSYRNILMP